MRAYCSRLGSKEPQRRPRPLSADLPNGSARVPPREREACSRGTKGVGTAIQPPLLPSRPLLASSFVPVLPVGLFFRIGRRTIPSLSLFRSVTRVISRVRLLSVLREKYQRADAISDHYRAHEETNRSFKLFCVSGY